MDDGIINYYYEKLRQGENPIVILTKLFSIIIDDNNKTPKNIYSVIGKLNNIYGTNAVFMSLLEMTSIENLEKYSTIGLLRNICKRKFEEKLNTIIINKDITNIADANLKDLHRKRKLNIPDIGEFNDNR